MLKYFLALICLLALPLFSNAALIYSQNHVTDSETGLSWLKLSLSTGLSAGNIYTQNGWGIAGDGVRRFLYNATNDYGGLSRL